VTEVRKRLTIVIPALNEEKAISKTIAAIPKADLEHMGYNIQVLIVDNGSTDRTTELAKKAGAEVIFEPKRGYGMALKAGFASAQGDVIVTADADATYPLEEIPLLLAAFENDHLDFLTTNRFAGLDKGAMSLQNRIGNTILALETRVLFGLAMNDPESGMWLFTKDILSKLRLHSNSWPLSHEIKIEACYYGEYPWKEVPIRYRARTGETKLLNGWKVGLIDLLHIAKKRIVR
jgi:glycosyltransferase involved in cell wall biosynthesis